MKLSYSVLDVFTTTPYQGNPLAIVNVPRALKSTLTEAQKQAIAIEFNFSETVFLHEVDADDTQADYDIFTIKAHIAFAGHPTIGTAVYIKNFAPNQFPNVTNLSTIAGLIPLQQYDQATSQATVLVPQNVHIHSQQLNHPFPELSPNPTSPSKIPIVSIVKGMSFSLVPIASVPQMQNLSKGMLPVEQVYSSPYLDTHDQWNQGLHNTMFYVDLTNSSNSESAESSVDAIKSSNSKIVRKLRTRGFGLREDPGTGSASCALCSYLSLCEPLERGRGPFEFHLTQGVEMGRPCEIGVVVTRTEDGKGIERVALRGSAVLMMRGELNC